MLRESGRVVAIESDAVWVETIRSSLCGSCAAKAGCGQDYLTGDVGDVPAIAGFISGLALGFLLVRIIPAWTGQRETFEPRLAAIRKSTPDANVLASG